MAAKTLAPQHGDAPMDVVLTIALRARPQALLFKSANPRHAHEQTVFPDAKLPDVGQGL